MNKERPSLEEVRGHFKDAKIVRGRSGGSRELTFYDYQGIHLCSSGRYYTTNGKVQLYSHQDGYAEIIEYKTPRTCGMYNFLTTKLYERYHTNQFNMNEIKIQVPEGHEIDKNNSTFESIKFKKIEKELPNSWEEYLSYTEGIRYSFSEIYARIPKDLKAMQQLRLLRDCYNDGGVADWLDSNENKYTIYYSYDKLKTTTYGTARKFLNFKTAELRDLFLKNFRDIIEIAKPLL